MKLLIATGIYPPDIGGPATNTKILAEEFSARGHEVTVVTYGDGENSDVGGMFKVVKVSRRNNILCRYAHYFLTILKYSRRSDVLFVQGPISAGLPVFLAKPLTGRRYVLRIVGDHAWEQARQRFGVEEDLDDFQRKSYGFRVGTMKFFQSIVSRAASKVVVPSGYLKGIAAGWGVEQSRIEVVFNSVEASLPEESREEIRQKTGLSGTVIVSIGRLVPWKGFSGLIRAFAKLCEDGERRELVIIGDGPGRTELEMLVKELGLGNGVRMTGRLGRADTMGFLKAADIFALNTAYEGLPHTVIEAMIAGVPVVTTDVGGNPEIVQDGETGLLVRYGDIGALAEAIRRLEDDAGLKNKLVSNARGRLDRFAKDRMVEEMMRVLGGENDNKTQG